MTKRKVCFIGQTHLPSIWSVDDAWFEGVGHFLSINDELGLEQNVIYRESDLLKCYLAFDELFNKIEERKAYSQQEINSFGDFIYLQELSKLCSLHHLGLVLCNFEYLDGYFSEIDTVNNAILVDVNYSNAERGGAENYGIRLLANLLNGKRPRADIFFVTSYPHEIETTRRSNRENSKWWIMRSIPYVSKGEKLHLELDAFVKFFLEKVQRDIFRDLSDSLVQANQENFSHPESIERDIPENFIFKEYFLYESNRYLARESFKGLYHYNSGTLDGLGERQISLPILRKYFNFCGIHLDITTDSHSWLFLPVQPGILFLLNLLKYLSALEESQVALTINSQNDYQQATLEVPLNLNKNPEALKMAIVTGGGQATEFFRHLLACRKNTFLNSASNRDSAQKCATLWKRPEPLNFTTVYKALVDYEFTEKSLTIYWGWEGSTIHRSPLE